MWGIFQSAFGICHWAKKCFGNHLFRELCCFFVVFFVMCLPFSTFSVFLLLCSFACLLFCGSVLLFYFLCFSVSLFSCCFHVFVFWCVFWFCHLFVFLLYLLSVLFCLLPCSWLFTRTTTTTTRTTRQQRQRNKNNNKNNRRSRCNKNNHYSKEWPKLERSCLCVPWGRRSALPSCPLQLFLFCCISFLFWSCWFLCFSVKIMRPRKVKLDVNESLTQWRFHNVSAVACSRRLKSHNTAYTVQYGKVEVSQYWKLKTL